MATLGEQAVGSTIKFSVNGALTEFLVLHQGKPSEGYDASCDGTWVQTKNALESGMAFGSTTDYATSSVNQSLAEFVNTIDSRVLPYIHTVTLNYDMLLGSSSPKTVTAKAFLLSFYEAGLRGLYGYVPNDGTVALQYYTPEGAGSNSKRIVTYSGIPTGWWTRTRSTYSGSNEVIWINSSGAPNTTYPINPSGRARRPAMVLDKELQVDDSGNIVFNQPPTVPEAIYLPDTIVAEADNLISWGASTDPEGGLAGYILERKLGSGDWTQVYKGIALSCTDSSIPFGTTSVQYRVCAYDTENLQSEYMMSAEVPVVNNRPPVITGSDTQLGELAMTPPSITYTVTDPDEGDTLTAVITLDSTQLESKAVVSGEEQSFSVSSDKWLEVLNGTHTLTVTATDQQGASGSRIWTMTKAVQSIQVQAESPAETEEMCRRAILDLTYAMPEGGSLKVEICNNALDSAPTWEDMTSAFLNGDKFFFQNQTKTAESWAYSWRVTISREGQAGECWLYGGSGACD